MVWRKRVCVLLAEEFYDTWLRVIVRLVHTLVINTKINQPTRVVKILHQLQ